MQSTGTKSPLPSRADTPVLQLVHRLAAATDRGRLQQVVETDLVPFAAAGYYTLQLNSTSAFFFQFNYNKNQLSREEYLSRQLVEEVISSKQAGIVNYSAMGTYPLPPAGRAAWRTKRIRQAILFPLHFDKTDGVFCLYRLTEKSTSQAEIDLLAYIASFLAIAMNNIQYREQNQQPPHYGQNTNDSFETPPSTPAIPKSISPIIGDSAAMRRIATLTKQVAHSEATVLITGETGTGKELLAQAIHQASDRHDREMIRVNCAALPPNLLESELFGHERGSFTGATETRTGRFELAHNSTIFLDEIAELPLDMQAKLLRVIQEKEIERIGSGKTISINIRIIAATNRTLQQEVAAGRFRSDLYYRLNVFPIELPPLRERREDLPALTSYFVKTYAAKTGRKVQQVSARAARQLESYPFPGNIRELEHLVQRSVLLATGAVIKDFPLPQERQASVLSPAALIVQPLQAMEKEYILNVVSACGGRIAGPLGAARKLGLPPTTLLSKMKKLGIQKEDYR